jgi:hypothetical protein
MGGCLSLSPSFRNAKIAETSLSKIWMIEKEKMTSKIWMIEKEKND